LKNKALFRKSLKKNGILYLFLLPMIIYILIFNYMPLAGLQIAFKDFVATKGIWGSEWVGFKYFQQFFSSPMFWKLLKNTLVISLYQLVFSYPHNTGADPELYTQPETEKNNADRHLCAAFYFHSGSGGHDVRILRSCGRNRNHYPEGIRNE